MSFYENFAKSVYKIPPPVPTLSPAATGSTDIF